MMVSKVLLLSAALIGCALAVGKVPPLVPEEFVANFIEVRLSCVCV